MNALDRHLHIGFSHMNFFNSLYPWERGLTDNERIDRAVADMRELGANAFRPWIHWSVVEPIVTPPLQRIEDVTEDMVAEYLGDERLNWEPYDHMLDACTKAGIELHIVLGGGYDFGLPTYAHAVSGLRFMPGVVGREHYLGRLYLHARAAVRRYRSDVKLWQLENELNAAGETKTFVKWRRGGMWWDWSFLTAVMRTLHRAVKEEDPRALVSHNFQTDYRRLPGLLDWKNDVKRWFDMVDIIGVDRYPDYMLGYWSRGKEVARTVAAAKDISAGKPVMVLEAGYPTAPAFRGFSDRGQVSYLETAVAPSIEAGADGFYYYNLVSPEGSMRWFQGETFFEKIEPHWGLTRSDGSRKPGFRAFQAVCSSLLNS